MASSEFGPKCDGATALVVGSFVEAGESSLHVVADEGVVKF